MLESRTSLSALGLLMTPRPQSHNERRRVARTYRAENGKVRNVDDCAKNNPSAVLACEGGLFVVRGILLSYGPWQHGRRPHSNVDRNRFGHRAGTDAQLHHPTERVGPRQYDRAGTAA